MPTRRDFLKTTAAVTAGTVLAGCVSSNAGMASAAEASTTPRPARRQLDLLILGGTGFIGPHLVNHAISRGHRVTIFTRGRRQADLPASVTRLEGDRNGKLDALVGKKWDAVIDDSATNPDWVRQSAQLLKDNVGRYLYTSSTGVYYPYIKRGAEETWPIRLEADDPKDGSASYGIAKGKSENEVRAAFGDRAIVVRPTYIVGPGDTTDRFPYWPVRLARGGETLAPGHKDDPAQFIDVRDLTAFMVKLVEDERSGIYNGVGPRSLMTISQFLEQAKAAINSTSTFTWVDDYDFLRERKIFALIPWILMEGNEYGQMSASNAKSIAAGLTFRPMAETVRDTLAWWQSSVPEERKQKPHFGLTPELEAEALAAWHARGK
jgi:2'-hydroxyisoflavone reductase